MTSANKAHKVLPNIFFPLALMLAAGSVGCATAGGGHGRGRDLHVSATLAGGAARPIVSGPATLLHVGVDGTNQVSLYRVTRTTGASDADACAAAARGPATGLRRGASNRVNIAVASDEIVCVASAGAARDASVTWHARRADSTATTGGQLLASNDRDDR